MDILVIGGTRFIGPVLVEELLRHKHSVSLFNRGTNPRIFSSPVTEYRGDREQGFGIEKKFDAVIDLCAYNGEQSKRALAELTCDYFLHISSAAAYATPTIFPLREDSPIGLWPQWGNYNKNKVDAEKIVSASNMPHAIVRPVFILGKDNYCSREQFIYSHLKSQTPIRIPGNGEAIIQFVFVQDVARAIVSLVESKITGAFNCGGDEAVTLNALVKSMAKIASIDPIIEYNPQADQENFNEAEFPFSNSNFFCDSAKLKALGISFTPLLTGLEDDYQTYYKNL